MQTQDRLALFEGWKTMRGTFDAADAPRVEALARQALEHGEPLMAWDLCARRRELGTLGPQAEEQVAWIEGLALANSGAAAAAQALLEGLSATLVDRSAPLGSETFGLLARTYKDLWQRERDAGRRATLLAAAISHYRMAHQVSEGRTWSSINIATLLLAAGKHAEARQVAEDTITAIDDGRSGEDDVWTTLTLAEANLILEGYGNAGDLYQQARTKVPFGRLSSARRNARIVLEALGEPASRLEELLPAPRVVLFTGHRIDSDAFVRFPAESEGKAAATIREYLESIDAEVGIASAADGADILFLEAMLDRGAEIHVVLPAPEAEFMESSVNAAIPGNWRDRFGNVLKQATSVSVLGRDPSDAVDFLYANRVMLGMAALRVQRIGGRLSGLTIWNGGPGRVGGTGHTVRNWLDQKLEFAAFDPRSGLPRTTEEIQRIESAPVDPSRAIAALLFADVEGFSKLPTSDVVLYVTKVLPSLGKTLDALGNEVLSKNTWGDGLHVAFQSPESAARFAHAIMDACAPEKNRAAGLPESFRFRVSLHAGPVWKAYDPVTHAQGAFGPHVNWAARIEPVTPGGAVYASEAFAALLATSLTSSEFESVYVGNIPLAKEFGVFPTYRITRRSL